MADLTDREFDNRAAGLEWILCDVDGVLTDGRLIYDRNGPSHLIFHVRDGQGIKLAQKVGLRFGILSGRASGALERRALELRFDSVQTGVEDKELEFETFLERQGVDARKVAYIGDDLPDLVVMKRCGLSFAPADAAPEVLRIADCTLAAKGGGGVVREMIEAILKARGEWDQMVASFTLDD